MNKIYAFSVLMASATIMQSCNNNGNATATAVRTEFLDSTAMDTTVKPGDNFWLYANGNWNKTAIIPSTESATGGFLIFGKKAVKLCRSCAKMPQHQRQQKERWSKK